MLKEANEHVFVQMATWVNQNQIRILY